MSVPYHAVLYPPSTAYFRTVMYRTHKKVKQSLAGQHFEMWLLSQCFVWWEILHSSCILRGSKNFPKRQFHFHWKSLWKSTVRVCNTTVPYRTVLERMAYRTHIPYSCLTVTTRNYLLRRIWLTEFDFVSER